MSSLHELLTDRYIRELHVLSKHTQSINQQISLKQTYTVETFESSRNPNVLSASRFRSQSPSGLVSDFPIVALLALTVSIDRQVIRRVSSEIFPHQVTPEPSFAWSRSQDAHRSLSSSVRWHAPHTPFLLLFPHHPLLRTWAKTLARPVGPGVYFSRNHREVRRLPIPETFDFLFEA